MGDGAMSAYDRQSNTDDRRSLYFTDQGWTGGKVFDYAQDGVRQFLINNALFFLKEYRIDGIRYDEVTVMHYHGGDVFCRDLTSTVRYAKPQAIQIAEYWAWDRAFPVTGVPDGLGFDSALGDGLRDALRAVLSEAAGGAGSTVHLDRLENHDVVRWDYEHNRPRAPRVPALADPWNQRSCMRGVVVVSPRRSC
jgi:1,4-alpha-glucan branching enzyme